MIGCEKHLKATFDETWPCRVTRFFRVDMLDCDDLDYQFWMAGGGRRPHFILVGPVWKASDQYRIEKSYPVIAAPATVPTGRFLYLGLSGQG